MVDKFLSLETEKQRILALEVKRLTTVNKDERPVAVTAEIDRIAVFCGAADGTWRNFVRAHDELDLTPRPPEHSKSFGWSRRVGVACGVDKVVLVYRRKFTSADEDELWIDVVSFDDATEALDGSRGPIKVPRSALGIDSFGFCLWADRLDDQLLIVAQAFFTGAGSPPQLVLLTAPFPADDGTGLASAGSWTVATLDEGGWDFDARRKDDRLFIVHRKAAAAYAAEAIIPIDPGFSPPTVTISENPAQASQPLSEVAGSSLVLVEVSLPDGAVQVSDTEVFGELPQIHKVDPVVITVERLRSAILSFRRGGIGAGIDVGSPRWSTFLVMSTGAGWRAAPC